MSIGDSEINTIEGLMSELYSERPVRAVVQEGHNHQGIATRGGQARGLVVPVLDICIVMPIAVFLTAFAKSFSSKIGEQSGEAVGRAFSAWVKRVHHVDDRANFHIVRVMDKKKRIIAHLPKDLPPEAYDQLVRAVNDFPSRRFRRKYIVLVYEYGNNWRASYDKQPVARVGLEPTTGGL